LKVIPYDNQKEEGEMKGSPKIHETLNKLLAAELTAINQYMVHAEMGDNWGYERLHETVQKRAIVEMKHAEKLIERILFLEGIPIVSRLDEIHIGADVEKQLDNDWNAEADAIRMYNEGVRTAVSEGDNGTREMLESILKDEEDHIDWIEAQKDQISQMGLQNYLSEQIN
jgi:bacterioferritin